MEKLIVLAIALACIDVTWAQNAERVPIYKTEDLLRTPEITFSYREEIIEALSRPDIDLGLDTSQEYLREHIWQPGRPPQNLKEAKEQEKLKAEARAAIVPTQGFLARIERVRVLLTKIRTIEIRDPKVFHSVVSEIIAIGRTHISFGFETLIAYKMREIYPSCEMPLRGGA